MFGWSWIAFLTYPSHYRNLIGAAVVKIEADRQSLIKKDTKYALTYELDTNCIIRYIPPDSKDMADYHKNEEKMMYQLNYIKFWKNAELLDKLLATGNAYIVDFRRFLTKSKVGAKWEGCIKVSFLKFPSMAMF